MELCNPMLVLMWIKPKVCICSTYFALDLFSHYDKDFFDLIFL